MGTGPAVGEGTDEEGIVPKAASDYDGVGQVCWAVCVVVVEATYIVALHIQCPPQLVERWITALGNSLLGRQAGRQYGLCQPKMHFFVIAR